MAEFIGDLICTTREFIAQGFRSLPVLLGSTALVLGLAQGNFNYLFFFVGMFLLTPLFVILLNGGLELGFSFLPQAFEPLWLVKNAGAPQCSIFASGSSAGGPMNGVPSFWMSMIAFFIVYLFTNAKALYDKSASSKAPAAAVSARKSQAILSMVVLVALGVLVTLLRFATTCETGLGVLVSWVLGGVVANYWYTFMKACGLGRFDDLYGIANRILPLQSLEESDPTVCIPTSTS
jgi:hypothetical protein